MAVRSKAASSGSNSSARCAETKSAITSISTVDQLVVDADGDVRAFSPHLAVEHGGIAAAQLDLGTRQAVQVELSLGEVLAWTEGSRLELNCLPSSKIKLRCGDTAMFDGQMGRKGAHIAVRIDNKLINHQEPT